MTQEQGHYRKEHDFWDEKGSEDYQSLSTLEQQRKSNWIAWQGQAGFWISVADQAGSA
jgi:hypothetical protein